VQQAEDAEEIVQDVFVKLYHNKEEMLSNPVLNTWLYRIAINASLDHLRKAKALKSGGLLQRVFRITQEETPVAFEHPGVLLDKKQDAVLLFAALKKIPEQQRIAFLLQQTEGRTVAEVADILESSIQAAEALIKRAKENLRKQLHKDLFSM
jgi:RNA polymerase sigma-70 factor (ECF subfamily)